MTDVYVPYAFNILAAAPSPSPQLPSMIQWVRQSDGAVVAQEYAYSASGLEYLELAARPVAGDTATARLVAQSAIGGRRAYLETSAVDGVNGSAVVRASADGHLPKIIDGFGVSDFLQKNANLSDVANVASSRGNLLIADGTMNLPFPNAQGSTDTVVAHSLGVVPTRVILTPNMGAQGFDLTLSAYNRTASQFTVHGWASVARNATYPIDWIALG